VFTEKWADNPAFANGNGNNRLVQALNARKVYVIGDEYDDDSASSLAVAAGILSALVFWD
jgi:hypothetical protein